MIRSLTVAILIIGGFATTGATAEAARSPRGRPGLLQGVRDARARLRTRPRIQSRGARWGYRAAVVTSVAAGGVAGLFSVATLQLLAAGYVIQPAIISGWAVGCAAASGLSAVAARWIRGSSLRSQQAPQAR